MKASWSAAEKELSSREIQTVRNEGDVKSLLTYCFSGFKYDAKARRNAQPPYYGYSLNPLI